MDKNSSIEKWIQSAPAWIADQGTNGDWSRREILDPALDKILATVSGKQVLDLGCGEGRYSRVLKNRGAIVTGIDPVPQFIQHAQTHDPDSRYIEATAEKLPFENESFDLVISYLSIIDIADLDAASKEIARVLKSDGQLIIVTISNVASTTAEWIKDKSGNKLYRKVDRYMEHFAMDLEWRDIKIRNYHRPLSFILTLFLDMGFVLTKFMEPLPCPSDSNYIDEFRVPTFQIYELVKSI